MHKRLYGNRKRAKQALEDQDFTHLDVLDLLEAQGRKCAYCQGALTKFHIEHVVPIDKGGLNILRNIVISCPRCNTSKGTKDLEYWKELARGV